MAINIIISYYITITVLLLLCHYDILQPLRYNFYVIILSYYYYSIIISLRQYYLLLGEGTF